jgi:hypothetical protein
MAGEIRVKKRDRARTVVIVDFSKDLVRGKLKTMVGVSSAHRLQAKYQERGYRHDIGIVRD